MGKRIELRMFNGALLYEEFFAQEAIDKNDLLHAKVGLSRVWSGVNRDTCDALSPTKVGLSPTALRPSNHFQASRPVLRTEVFDFHEWVGGLPGSQ
jgi:hypothetical protein